MPAVVDPPEEAAAAAPRKGWFFHPYTQLSLSILFSAASQFLLKKGSTRATVPEVWLGIEGLRSGWVWLGIGATVASLFSWLYSLRFVPLNVAYNVAALIQAIVPLGSWLFLGERINSSRACGILLVCTGVFVIARPLMRVEEKL